MGFLKRLFKRKPKIEQIEDDFEQVVFERDGVDFAVGEERRRYVENCLEQIAEASKELNLLNGEYALVTSYLMDMEEIEALPEKDREEVNRIAGKVLGFEHEIQNYKDNKNRMSNADYYRIRGQEEEIEEGIRKLKETEEYRNLVKKDLRRLSGERSAYAYRKAELFTMFANYKGMATIFLTAFLALILVLLFLQFALKKNAMVGYFAAVAGIAVSMTVLGVKYMDAQRELKVIENTINKLILLQNKVKIRYVNNAKLLDYLHIKYNTESSAKLEKLWEKYKEEKEERRQFEEAEAKADFFKNSLVKKLSEYRIKDPDRWMNQTAALLDRKEMVEIRHDLILRRQALRKQLDYNNGVAEAARKEVKEVSEAFPEYAAEIISMVEQYEKMYDL